MMGVEFVVVIAGVGIFWAACCLLLVEDVSYVFSYCPPIGTSRMLKGTLYACLLALKNFSSDVSDSLRESFAIKAN